LRVNCQAASGPRLAGARYSIKPLLFKDVETLLHFIDAVDVDHAIQTIGG